MTPRQSTPRGASRNTTSRAALLRRRSTLLFEAAQIDAELAELETTGAPDTYSTEVGCWPPGCRTARAARERIRKVDGHEHVGSVWSVSVAEYRGAYTRRAPLRVAQPETVDDDELAEKALRDSGMRSTRRSA